MTPTQRLILWTYAAIVAAWPIRHLAISIIYAKFDVLRRDSPPFEAPDAPLVSAIIPAKDEEDKLGECLDSARAQNYPNLEILVVDDRSADRTPVIARHASERDPRVRVISIEHLPEGWTGKTHALHVASAEARGEWFWFLDADTRHAPESLSVMMEYARSNRAALASLLPEMRCESFWEKVVQPLAGIVLMRSFPLFRVNRDTHPLAFANGQYILMTRSAYDASGGHEAVRDRFVEDIYLAGRVKALGLPIRTAMSTDISSTRMYTGLPQIVRGWSRILYDALGRKPLPLVGKVVEPLVFSQTGDAAVIVAAAMLLLGAAGPFAWWLLGLGTVHQVLKTSVLYRMYKWSSPATAGYAAWYPLAGLVMMWVCARSIWMCLTGRVTWRGTSYGPKAALAGRGPSRHPGSYEEA